MRTPLHRSAYNGHVIIVDYLISHGADIDSKDIDDENLVLVGSLFIWHCLMVIIMLLNI